MIMLASTPSIKLLHSSIVNYLASWSAPVVIPPLNLTTRSRAWMCLQNAVRTTDRSESLHEEQSAKEMLDQWTVGGISVCHDRPAVPVASHDEAMLTWPETMIGREGRHRPVADIVAARTDGVAIGGLESILRDVVVRAWVRQGAAGGRGVMAVEAEDIDWALSGQEESRRTSGGTAEVRGTTSNRVGLSVMMCRVRRR